MIGWIVIFGLLNSSPKIRGRHLLKLKCSLVLHQCLVIIWEYDTWQIQVKGSMCFMCTCQALEAD